MALLTPGVVIAGYRIEALVGRGGMGVVYRARQLALDRIVAIKVIAPELVEDADTCARFLREARAAASFEHPNVIPVHDTGTEDGVAYIVMRFVAGDDLRRLVRSGGPLAPERAAEIAAQAAAALDSIHESGFVHRDVKPANLLVDPSGHIYLTDFGLVKHLLSHSGATRSWVGTIDYVAPEQIRGGRVDARADVYALGGVLHFMLTARVPFEREGEEAKLWAQLREPPPVPSRLQPTLPVELDAVIARAMAKEPEARYPSAGDLARAARAGVSGGAPSEPERMVARGAAAPGDAPIVPGLDAEAPTATAAPRDAEAATVVLRRRRWPGLVAGAAVAVVTAAVAAWATLADGGDDNDRAALGRALTATPHAVATAAAKPRDTLRVVGTTQRVGQRPSHLAVAGGDVWVTSYRDAVLTRVSRRTGRERRQHPPVGRGATDIAADRSALWVSVSTALQVVRVDARTGRVTRRIPLTAPPYHVAAGPSGLWVGVRPRGETPEVLHYDRAGDRLLSRTALENGVGPIALGGDALWVAGQAVPKVTRLDLRSGRVVAVVPSEIHATDLSYGAGYVWAAQRSDDSIARIHPGSGRVVTNEAGHAPGEVVASGGRIFVASSNDHVLRVLSAKTMRSVHEPLDLPFNPYGVALDGTFVWVSGRGGDTLTRVAYP